MPTIDVDIAEEGSIRHLWVHDMQKQSNSHRQQLVITDPTPGEFDDLLREIEKEAVPERLLALALKLQAALAERRAAHETDA